MKQVKFKLLFFAIINLTAKLNALEFYEVRIVSTFQSARSDTIIQQRLNYFFDKHDTASIFIKQLNDVLQKNRPRKDALDTDAYKQGLTALQNRLGLFDSTKIYSAPTVRHLFSVPSPKSTQDNLIMAYVEQVKKRSMSEFSKYRRSAK